MERRHHIENKIRQTFSIEHAEVLDESDRHNVPPGSESHFKVTVVSDEFEPLGLLARHRALNDLLRAELEGPVHALALHLYTPAEWARRNARPDSSPCMGGER